MRSGSLRSSVLVIIAAALIVPACTELEGRPLGDDERGLESQTSAVPMPRANLAASLRSPFMAEAYTDLSNCPADPSAQTCTKNSDCKSQNRLNECYIPEGETTGRCGHHRPWNGDWAIDMWTAAESTKGQPAYLRLSPSALPGGTPPDDLRVQPGAPAPACGSGNINQGGYSQTFTIYATYGGVEHDLGTVLMAHIDNVQYSGSTQTDLDPRELYIGDVWSPPGGITPCSHGDQGTCEGEKGCYWFNEGCHNSCWVGEHLHMELSNAEGDTESCWQNMCNLDGKNRPPVYGADSVIGFIGGSDDGDMCPQFLREESMPCSTWDGDIDGCNAHAHGTTQDCAYYWTSDTCRPRGTSNCQAGIDPDCGGPKSGPCSEFDGDVDTCGEHSWGVTQDCAYYGHSDRCMARGTPNCSADCDSPNCLGGACPQCNTPNCLATDPEL